MSQATVEAEKIAGKGRVIRPQKYGKHLKLLSGNVEIIQVYVQKFNFITQLQCSLNRPLLRFKKTASRVGKDDGKLAP